MHQNNDKKYQIRHHQIFFSSSKYLIPIPLPLDAFGQFSATPYTNSGLRQWMMMISMTTQYGIIDQADIPQGSVNGLQLSSVMSK